MTVVEAAAVRRVVAEAFVDDPLLQWIFPEPAQRADATAAWLGVFVDLYAAIGRIDTVAVDGEVAAVALWRIPSDVPFPRAELPSVPGLLTALAGTEHATRIGPSLGALGDGRPPHPYAYLNFLAVRPRHQGKGLGRQVIRPGLDAASALGLGAFLDTMNPRNHAFYRSVGFNPIRERALEPDGPTATGMWRDA